MSLRQEINDEIEEMIENVAIDILSRMRGFLEKKSTKASLYLGKRAAMQFNWREFEVLSGGVGGINDPSLLNELGEKIITRMKESDFAKTCDIVMITSPKANEEKTVFEIVISLNDTETITANL